MKRIVEEQSVKSPPTFPTQSQHMLGVNQLVGEHRENTHPQKLLKYSHSLESYRMSVVSVWDSVCTSFFSTPEQYFSVVLREISSFFPEYFFHPCCILQ